MESVIHSTKTRRRKNFREVRLSLLKSAHFSKGLRHLVPAISREEAVEEICRTSPYADRYEVYPVSFNVKARDAELSPVHLWNLGVERHFPRKAALDPGEVGVVFNYFRSLCIENREDIFPMACEQAWDCNFENYNPELFPGLKLSLRGRQSGHLVVTELMGRKLEGLSQQGLRSMLLEKEGKECNSPFAADTPFAASLYFLCALLGHDATPEKASREVEYQASEVVWLNFFDENEAVHRAQNFNRVRSDYSIKEMFVDYGPEQNLSPENLNRYFEPIHALATAAGLKSQ